MTPSIPLPFNNHPPRAARETWGWKAERYASSGQSFKHPRVHIAGLIAFCDSVHVFCLRESRHHTSLEYIGHKQRNKQKHIGHKAYWPQKHIGHKSILATKKKLLLATKASRNGTCRIVVSPSQPFLPAGPCASLNCSLLAGRQKASIQLQSLEGQVLGYCKTPEPHQDC